MGKGDRTAKSNHLKTIRDGGLQARLFRSKLLDHTKDNFPIHHLLGATEPQLAQQRDHSASISRAWKKGLRKRTALKIDVP